MSENNANDTLVMFFKVVVVIVFVYPFLHYALFKGDDVQPAENKTEPATNETEVPIEVKPVPVVRQPTCPVSYLLVILQELCTDLHLQHEQCTPEDFYDLEKHKLPRNNAKNTTGEPRGTIVGCVAAGLLLTSLGAAFLELYKAKSHTPVKNTKPMISRKCSLADLTVLKHNRKELVRRESIMEIPETGGTLKPLGRKVSRPPLRLD
ncbi:hypothetical protein Zmor_022801 [Zophobas morio]|uniref:Uncharacterized protein n=1 Tax=Zophobas morio TaxID=2755281 RepID=A0AA38M6Z0_9CUCU|nr:hypothetical protein Zmor_022801 [Zophobas morio]